MEKGMQNFRKMEFTPRPPTPPHPPTIRNLRVVKRSPLKRKFWDFRVLGQNSPKHKSVPPQILHHSSVLWHVAPLPFFGSFQWNFLAETYALDKNSPIKLHFFRLLIALMKVHPLHAIFETTRSGFIQILHHCSVSWKITPLYFCSLNLIYFGQKEPIEKKFSGFWVVGLKFTKFLMLYLRPQVSFSLNFASHFSVMRDNCSALF